ncbi:MAG: hypothetical protein WC647_08735 [Desulfomonilaceae bacterium]|jgi:hypothetical protein
MVTILKHIRILAHVSLLIFVVMAPSVRAEFLPWNIPVNSSFRVGYLYGSQVVSSASDQYSGNTVQLDISFGFPILSGAIELAPINRLSVRMIGDVSVYGQQNIIYGPWWTPTSGAPNGLYSDARPGYVGVEAAGLFDVWRSAGHRFGVIGGWRREYWWYNDEETSDMNASVGSHDDVTSTIPFVGLCAEMAYPGWRSTFEFLTSRFVYKTLNGSVRQNQYGEYHCVAQDGVLLEGRIQGMAPITSNLLLGLYGRYSYQNVAGGFDGLKDSIVTRSLDVHVVENTLTLELQLTFFFW